MPKPKSNKHVIDVADDTPIPLDVEPALVEFLILKARAFDVKVAPVEPDAASNAIDEGERAVLEDIPSDQTELELRDAIEQLSEDAALDLLAIFWIGRGDFDREEWEQTRQLAAERLNKPLADYLMGEPNLGDFLEEGIIALGYTPQDYGPT